MTSLAPEARALAAEEALRAIETMCDRSNTGLVFTTAIRKALSSYKEQTR